jgi:hypothetical protein
VLYRGSYQVTDVRDGLPLCFLLMDLYTLPVRFYGSYKQPYKQRFLAISQDWKDEVKCWLPKLLGTTVADKPISYRIGMTFTSNVSEHTVPLTAEYQAEIKEMLSTRSDVEEVFVYWSAPITVRKYRATGPSEGDRDVLGVLTYCSSASLDEMVQMFALGFGSRMSRVFDLGPDNVGLVYEDLTTVTDRNILLNIVDAEFTVYLVPLQTAYSQLTAFVLTKFRFPDLWGDHNVAWTEHVFRALHTKGANHALVSQLDDKVALAKEAMAAGTEEGVRWQANLVRVVDYLHLLARVAPPLRSINQALRVTAIEHVLLHACDTVACQLRSGAKLCKDFKHLPAHYAGFGPFDYILGNGRAVLLNALRWVMRIGPGIPPTATGSRTVMTTLTVMSLWESVPARFIRPWGGGTICCSGRSPPTRERSRPVQEL